MIKIEDLKITISKNIILNTLPAYDDGYIKTKIRTYDDKVYNNFRGLNVPDDGVECKSFTIFLLILFLFTKSHIICKYI